MAVDVSAFQGFLPILSFLLVLFITYIVIHKSKLIENKLASALIAVIVAVIFVVAGGANTYLLTVVPAFAVVLVGLFFFLALGGFLQKDLPTKGIGIAFLIILAIVFVVSAIFVFAHYYTPYLPGGENATSGLLSWLYSPKVAGALLIIGVGAIAVWVLIKSK